MNSHTEALLHCTELFSHKVYFNMVLFTSNEILYAASHNKTFLKIAHHCFKGAGHLNVLPFSDREKKKSNQAVLL